MARSEWRIHLGAHKTATTHLQQTLALMGLAPELDTFRDRFWRTPAERKILGRDLLSKRRWSAIREFTDFLVLSDENILCEAHEACRGFDHAFVEARLRKLARITAGKPTKVFLGIRNPAEFAASAYSEALRHRPEMVDRQSTIEAWSKRGNWYRLVKQISAHFDLTVWRYEDYRRHRLSIIEALTGQEFSGEPPDPSVPASTQRLSLREVEAIEAGTAGSTAVPATRCANSNEAFQLFGQLDRSALAVSYHIEAEDIQSLARFLTWA